MPSTERTDAPETPPRTLGPRIISLRHPHRLLVEGFRTMKSHVVVTYSSDMASLKIELSPEQAQALTDVLTAEVKRITE